jgi:phage internal scaffolding protein
MFNTGFNMDNDILSYESGLVCTEESLAIQSAEEESNINTIVRRFGISGELPNNLRMPQSGDFTNAVDFHTAMNLVRQAQEEFVRVPAEIRARFNNDPARFMAFIEDGSNYEEALKLGLVNKRPDSVPPSGTPEGGAAAG